MESQEGQSVEVMMSNVEEDVDMTFGEGVENVLLLFNLFIDV